MSTNTAKKKAVSRKDLTYRQWIWKEMKRNWVAYLMILPYVLIFTVFTVAPVLHQPGTRYVNEVSRGSFTRKRNVTFPSKG